jgi:hypothetical protein
VLVVSADGHDSRFVIYPGISGPLIVGPFFVTPRHKVTYVTAKDAGRA